MKKTLSSLLVAAGTLALAYLPSVAQATNYAGNGGTGFNGAVGSGTLSVITNASGAFVFSFTLGGGQTNLGGNDIAIYIDNGKGNGIGSTTVGLTDTSDGGRQTVSQFNGGTNRSTTVFNGLFSPQYGLDLSVGNASVYGLVNGGTFSFLGGQTIGGASQLGVTYTVTTSGGSTVFTETVPASVLGLTANTAVTLKLFAMQVSETGYSSNEATVALTGSQGYGNTQTISAINTFTAVPEPGTWAMLAAGGLGALAVARRRMSSFIV